MSKMIYQMGNIEICEWKKKKWDVGFDHNVMNDRIDGMHPETGKHFHGQADYLISDGYLESSALGMGLW